MKFREFELDQFQEEAINSIDDNHSVMVSAPTGSGKTLIADYIIDRDIKEGKRVIYTAPIKALSNQKFRDFREQYGEENIGLITGDVVVNSRAQVLIMTTEIYRNMAVVKDPVLNDVSYCIMDEIHYINDTERGYIWEESIIFSPEHIRFLFLSATVPNAPEFAAWVKSIKGHDVVTVRHDERPVPLDIRFYDKELGITTLDDIQHAAKVPDYYRATGRRQHRREAPKPPMYYDIIRELGGNFPCIYFVFSRARTQDYAMKLAQRNDFLNAQERAEMSRLVTSHFSALSSEVGTLRSTKEIRQCLSKGIAFHHAGLLPDVKHVVEQLFGKGLIKVLFATETFAVGINMPAKTVCFDSLRKYTGEGFRYLNSKEFFQIAGRAGRRGIDTRGLVVALLYRQGADMRRIAEFTSRDTEPIKSQFKISYNTVLNMVDLHSPDEIEQILTMSFYAFQEGGAASVIKHRYNNLIKTLTDLEYIRDGELTDLGRFTTKIYSNEIEISQLFAGGLAVDEYEMLLLIGSLIYEERKDDEFHKTYPSKTVDKLVKELRRHKVLQRGTWWKSMKNITALIHPLIDQKKFIEILPLTSKPEGDLIRFYMQLLDKLEQVDRASQDDAMIATARNGKNLIRNMLEGIHMF